MIAVVVPCATVHIFSYFFFCLNFVRLFPACRLSPSADLILLLSAAVAAAAVLCLPASLSVCLLSFLLFDALLNRVCPSFALIFWSFLSLSLSVLEVEQVCLLAFWQVHCRSHCQQHCSRAFSLLCNNKLIAPLFNILLMCLLPLKVCAVGAHTLLEMYQLHLMR